MDIPVFLITGFLESGKTSFINETIRDPEFASNDNTLIICCEEGIEEYNIKELASMRIYVEFVEDMEELNEQLLKKLNSKYKPKRILIEYNGTWPIEYIADLDLPKKWMLVQIITTADATTFLNYINNMGNLMVDSLSNADMIIFNRCTPETDKLAFRRKIKMINRQAQIIYESVDGEVGGEVEEELPFDINADTILIEDDDYGLWYMDAADNPRKYDNKVVCFKGMVYKNGKFPDGFFVPGRFAMTCCADDLAFVGFITKYSAAGQFKDKDWVKVTAKVRCEYNPAYKGEGPILYATSVVKDEEPEEKVVYFT